MTRKAEYTSVTVGYLRFGQRFFGGKNLARALAHLVVVLTHRLVVHDLVAHGITLAGPRRETDSTMPPATKKQTAAEPP